MISESDKNLIVGGIVGGAIAVIFCFIVYTPSYGYTPEGNMDQGFTIKPTSSLTPAYECVQHERHVTVKGLINGPIMGRLVITVKDTDGRVYTFPYGTTYEFGEGKHMVGGDVVIIKHTGVNQFVTVQPNGCFVEII